MKKLIRNEKKCKEGNAKKGTKVEMNTLIHIRSIHN